MDIQNRITAEIDSSLSPQRLCHTRSACSICVSLARRFSLDPAAAWIAAMWHDSAREWEEQKLKDCIKEHGIQTTALERRVPMLLHAPAAAWRLVHELGCRDMDVFQAVRWHTTGHPGMTRLGYALVTADFLEPGRTHIRSEERNYILGLPSLELMMIEILRRQFAFFSVNNVDTEPESLRLYKLLKQQAGSAL